MPGDVPQEALNGLVWAMAIGIGIGIGIVPLQVLAWRFTLKVPMTEEPLKEIQATIYQQRETR